VQKPCPGFLKQLSSVSLNAPKLNRPYKIVWNTSANTNICTTFKESTTEEEELLFGGVLSVELGRTDIYADEWAPRL
jgi:hypothetical protein